MDLGVQNFVNIIQFQGFQVGYKLQEVLECRFGIILTSSTITLKVHTAALISCNFCHRTFINQKLTMLLKWSLILVVLFRSRCGLHGATLMVFPGELQHQTRLSLAHEVFGRTPSLYSHHPQGQIPAVDRQLIRLHLGDYYNQVNIYSTQLWKGPNYFNQRWAKDDLRVDR